MSNNDHDLEEEMLEPVSLAAKQFYSAGTSFSALGCAAVVAFVWSAMAEIYSPLSSRLCGLLVSFAIVYAYAWVIPEPNTYRNAGKLRLTLSEAIFGFINSFLVFSTAVALKLAVCSALGPL